jgi:hypothetical protein
VVVEVVDVEPRGEGARDLGPQLTLHLAQVGLFRYRSLTKGKVAVFVHQRRRRLSPDHRSPPIVSPLGVEREVNSDGRLRCSRRISTISRYHDTEHDGTPRRGAPSRAAASGPCSRRGSSAVVAADDEVDAVRGRGGRGLRHRNLGWAWRHATTNTIRARPTSAFGACADPRGVPGDRASPHLLPETSLRYDRETAMTRRHEWGIIRSW